MWNILSYPIFLLPAEWIYSFSGFFPAWFLCGLPQRCSDAGAILITSVCREWFIGYFSFRSLLLYRTNVTLFSDLIFCTNGWEIDIFFIKLKTTNTIWTLGILTSCPTSASALNIWIYKQYLQLQKPNNFSFLFLSWFQASDFILIWESLEYLHSEVLMDCLCCIAPYSLVSSVIIYLWYFPSSVVPLALKG